MEDDVQTGPARLLDRNGEHHPDAQRFGARVPVLQVHAELHAERRPELDLEFARLVFARYITIQLWLLLDTALRVRAAGVIGAVLAIAPVMTGIVIGVLWTIGYLSLSGFQLNALAMLIATGIVEFVSTLWVRHVLLQRGMTVVDPQAT